MPETTLVEDIVNLFKRATQSKSEEHHSSPNPTPPEEYKLLTEEPPRSSGQAQQEWNEQMDAADSERMKARVKGEKAILIHERRLRAITIPYKREENFSEENLPHKQAEQKAKSAVFI